MFLSLILRTKAVTTQAMRACTVKESAAYSAYKLWQEALGHTVEVHQWGLILHDEFPIIGCSPDGWAVFS